jgi:hypothetical protein
MLLCDRIETQNSTTLRAEFDRARVALAGARNELALYEHMAQREGAAATARLEKARVSAAAAHAREIALQQRYGELVDARAALAAQN